MKYDITLDGTDYVVEIDDQIAKVLDKKKKDNKKRSFFSGIDLPDFDFAEDGGNSTFVKASLPGTVLSITVKAGEKVSKGQTVAILESMKMENAIPAPCNGIVDKIWVKSGTYVQKNQDIITFLLDDSVQKRVS